MNIRKRLKFGKTLPNELSKIFSITKESDLKNVSWLIKLIESDYGHNKSFASKLSVDNRGNPIPWFTYPSIEYLSQFDFTKNHVFEYGCGNGSLYWSKRVKTISSVDHDPEWYKQIVKKKRKNQKLYIEEEKDKYVHKISWDRKKYDLIVIDGEFRLACAKVAIKHINNSGLIILDNSDWFVETATFLRKSGLMQVDFSGLGPINYYTWTTSLFFTKNSQQLMKNLKSPTPVGGRKVKLDIE